ncbi:hypothetical protein QJS66_00935 [Kocuria rhizophila]|nr:hypothetical protein QJS66_00935 [Kocuria rhizophila]
MRPGDRVNLMVPPGSMLTTLVPRACASVRWIVVASRPRPQDSPGRARLLAPLVGPASARPFVGARPLARPAHRRTDAMNRVQSCWASHTVPTDRLRDHGVPGRSHRRPGRRGRRAAASQFTGPGRGAVVYTHRQMAGCATPSATRPASACRRRARGGLRTLACRPRPGRRVRDADMDVTSQDAHRAGVGGEPPWPSARPPCRPRPPRSPTCSPADELAAERDALARVDLVFRGRPSRRSCWPGCRSSCRPTGAAGWRRGAAGFTDVSLGVIRTAREDAQAAWPYRRRRVHQHRGVRAGRAAAARGSRLPEIVTTRVTGKIVAHAARQGPRPALDGRACLDGAPGWRRAGDRGASTPVSGSE